MRLVVTGEARAFRRAVGVTAWAVLEELALDADTDDSGSLVARTNVRAVAAQLGISKDTAARAINRLARAGVVRRVIGERGDRGALPTSSYSLDLTRIDGLSVHASESPRDARVASVDASSPTTRRPTRVERRVDDAQTSLFDVPASVS